MEQFTITANKSGGYIVGNLICGDSKTTTIHIVIPRMSGAIDLSVLTFVVNIKNSANKTDIAPVFNRIVSDEYIEFDWIPGGIATSDIGITRFEIEGVNANNAIWQSSTYLLRILKSLDSEAIDEENVISELHQMIILVDDGLRKAEEAANIALQISEHLPIIGENGNWLLWDTETNSYVDSNKSTKGDEGEPGKDGISVTHEWSDSTLTITSASGVSSADLKGPSGKDGVSPIVYVSVINDGHRLFIEDINGTKSFDVLDGKDGVGISSARLNDDYTLTLNFSDGSSHTTSSIRGEVGPSGSDGYTPVRGIDYWTDADKVEVVRDTTKQFPFLAQSDEIIYVLENSDIDTTLTQAGKVADAKAVGDAINQFSDKLAVEHSLSGNTSELTPLQVAEAFTAGKTIRLTHTDAQLGTVTVSDFKYLEEYNMVVSSGVQQVFDTLISYALSGVATRGAGWAFVMNTVPTTDQVPTKVSQLNNDAGFVTQEDLDSLSEEIIDLQKEVFPGIFNLFDLSKAVSGYIANSTGAISGSSTYYTTDYIFVAAGRSIVVAPMLRKLLAYTSDTKSPIADTYFDRETYAPYYFTASEDCYVRISLYAKHAESLEIRYIDAIPVDLQIASFGDSIAFGDGNSGVGIADVVAAHLNTSTSNISANVWEYAKGGATIAWDATDAESESDTTKRQNIQYQVTKCIGEHSQAPDIILLDGGTNDNGHGITLGEISDGYDATLDNTTYCGGLETIIKALKNAYPAAMLIFVLVHRMGSRDNAKQDSFAEKAIAICNKWSVGVADVFHNSNLNTFLEAYHKYTNATTDAPNGDKTHPTQEGYEKFYLPIVMDKIKKLKLVD